MPVPFESAREQVRTLLGARAGGFTEVEGTEELAVIVGERTLYVQVLPFGPDAAVVQVMAPLLAGAADTDELAEALATAPLDLTRPIAVAEGGGRTVLLVHRFLGDQLRADVVDHVLATVATDADRLDPELESRFGATWTLEGGG